MQVRCQYCRRVEPPQGCACGQKDAFQAALDEGISAHEAKVLLKVPNGMECWDRRRGYRNWGIAAAAVTR